MIYQQKNNQVSYGEAIGILLLDSPVPFIPGDVANATSYTFLVRFKRVAGFSVEKAIGGDKDIYPALLCAARNLKENGVRAITGDCGFMAVHQDQLKKDLNMPVFLSSLLQIPFIRQLIPDDQKIGIITASQRNLTESFLKTIGIREKKGMVVVGLENSPEFKSAALDEKGSLDSEKIKTEVLEKAGSLIETHKEMGAILLECSLLPPYAKGVADKTGLPVFDYMTMIDFVFSAVVKKKYRGYM